MQGPEGKVSGAAVVLDSGNILQPEERTVFVSFARSWGGSGEKLSRRNTARRVDPELLGVDRQVGIRHWQDGFYSQGMQSGKSWVRWNREPHAGSWLSLRYFCDQTVLDREIESVGTEIPGSCLRFPIDLHDPMPHIRRFAGSLDLFKRLADE